MNRNFKLFSGETGIILMHVFNQFFKIENEGQKVQGR